MLVENQMVEVKWNNSNKKHLISKGYIFSKIGDAIDIEIKDISKGSNTLVLAKCDYCNKNFKRKMQLLSRNKNNRHFCNNKCQTTFSSTERLNKKPFKQCENCKEDYKYPEHRRDSTRFCSYTCLSEWQSNNMSGENSPLYVKRYEVECDWCGSKVKRTKNKLESQNFNFCNKKCQQDWHREILTKSDSFLDKSRETMLNNLSEGKIKMTETVPHKLINELLEEQGIKYKNEIPIFQYAVDIHLQESDLYIEINGGYWHCDNRIYTNIKHDHQLERIIKDKRKRTYLLNSLNKNILYLWEYDIVNNPDLCKKLINHFIMNKGITKNYHSMNYSLEKNELKINDEIIVPFMDYELDSLFVCTDVEMRSRVTGYDETKHQTFQCDECGADKTQLKVIYDKSKNHFCSVSCNNKYRGKQKKINNRLFKTTR